MEYEKDFGSIVDQVVQSFFDVSRIGRVKMDDPPVGKFDYVDALVRLAITVRDDGTVRLHSESRVVFLEPGR